MFPTKTAAVRILRQPFVEEFAETLGLTFVPAGHGNFKKTIGPEDIFDYAYAIFHSPSYRERYGEFLKLDFPRLPLASDPTLFRRLSEQGKKLVALHTMREHGPDDISYDTAGNDMVERVVYVPPKSAVATKPRRRIVQPDLEGRSPKEDAGYKAGPTGRVYINSSQYFEGITPAVWGFRIGGYQVAEKWLKDPQRPEARTR